jgi:hypothetical protein
MQRGETAHLGRETYSTLQLQGNTTTTSASSWSIIPVRMGAGFGGQRKVGKAQVTKPGYSKENCPSKIITIGTVKENLEGA